MIEVRIRHDYEAESIHLCEWESNDLDAVIPTLGAWGIHTDAGDYQAKDLTGQITVEETRAYFELVVHTEDDDG